MARVGFVMDGPFLVVLSSVGIGVPFSVSVSVSVPVAVEPPSEITRWLNVASGFIGVVIGVVISQGED